MKRNSLNNISKTGFKVPKDYFKNFEDTLFSELKLKEVSSTTGFTVPKNYFETLDNHILNTIKEEKEHKVINLFPWKKMTYIASIAASLIVMFNVFFNNNENLSINNIETASIENYILDEGLENNDIASLFTNDDLSEITIIKNNISSETLEDYVLDNIDVDEIITTK